MLCVSVEEPHTPGTSFTDYLVLDGQQRRIVASIQLPDVSDWDGYYHRWYVQVLLRWIPTTILGASSVLAAAFLHRHLSVMNMDFNSRFPRQDMRTRQRLFKFIGGRLSNVHLILAIEMTSTFVLCAVIGIGGWQSNAILPTEVTSYFITGLSGWGVSPAMFLVPYRGPRLSRRCPAVGTIRGSADSWIATG